VYSGDKVARDTLTCVGRENGGFDPAFRGFRKVIGSREEGGQICHRSMNIVQMKRGFSNLRRRSLGNVLIGWGQSGGRRFTGLRVQDPGLFGGSGRRRRKKSEKISSNDIGVSGDKR